MKEIYSVNCALFRYKAYQKQISKIGKGDTLSLKAKQKENGYTDVFAYNGNEEVGEFFREESTDLLPFVSNLEKFKIETVVNKLLPKESDMVAVIVDVTVYSDEDIDAYEYIDAFYEEKDDETEEPATSEQINTILNSLKEKQTKEQSAIEQKRAELFDNLEFKEIQKDIEKKIQKEMESESNANALKGCLIFIIVVGLLIALFKTCSSSKDENEYSISNSDSAVVTAFDQELNTQEIRPNRVFEDKREESLDFDLSKKEVLKLDKIEQISYLSKKYDELNSSELMSVSDNQFKEIRSLYLDGVFDDKPLCMACIEHNALMKHNYPEEYLKTGYFKENFPKYKGKNFSVILSVYCPIFCAKN